MAPAPPPVIWFRPSVTRPVTKAWVQSATLVAGGAIALGVLRSTEDAFDAGSLVPWLVGIALLMSGPLWLAVRLARILGRENVLSLHADGVRWQVGQRVEAHWRWEAITTVSEAAPATLAIELADAPPFIVNGPWDGTDVGTVRRVILELRQKAMLGLPVRPRPTAS